METRAHHVLIGLFTLLVGVAAVAFSIWISSASTSKEYHYYTVVFREAVTGLSRGSAVKYSGIPVGDIVELTLDPEDPRQVLARIRLDVGTPVRKDTRARLSFTGITGNSIIELRPGDDPQSPPLHSEEGEPPRIYATPSPISSLLANGEDLMTNINQLVVDARALLSNENTKRISQTLASIEQTVGSLASQGNELSKLIGELTRASQQVGALMSNTNHLINERGSRTLESAEQTLASIARTSAVLETLLANNSEAFASGMQGLGQLEPAINELRGSLKALRAVTRSLGENPARFLLGRDAFEEFEP
ncbi:MAG TPA: MCE family protein [Nitrosomonas nitrosa]|uniref:Phospholipid/cholesterol/gamma-HCH transport system substrate-binding protein n=1 Tax=Nitrosomonas nitrosa TaxID=52442 RepID=A0A1I4UJS2_9PROT|nr:MlaD family protein [Nitrosomonas nitrosa]CAE6489369.1 Phospholipid/cholesterol/gamma-HCH transport system substrate-binding protein [Nitrosomonas nitrosa]SFM89151.1 phospholipid/cholesterol/gamma-HCH transport system substrate-binding protein [Nitrosomonas nitrosa]HBZ30329.1 MCE family protein [Nitrosomonas nitrosa]HNP52338.1 MlaD family protein [Nitrosomonas nitrosa]